MIAHADGHLHEADAVEIFDVDRVGVIALLRIVPAHEHEVLNADRHRAQQISL